jgi:hypothetical protein
MGKTNRYFDSTILQLSSTQEPRQAVLTFCEKMHGKLPKTAYHWYNTDGQALSIETVRQLLGNLAYAASADHPRICILLAADSASTPAQNALLKVLEEPPAHTRLILTTHKPGKLLPTILSRCLSVDLSQESVKQTPEDLRKIEEHAKELAGKLKQLSYNEIIDLSEQYKSREEAEQLLRALMLAIHQHQPLALGESEQLQRVSNLLSCQQALNQLEMNANVRLVLENCFFSVKNSQ